MGFIKDSDRAAYAAKGGVRDQAARRIVDELVPRVVDGLERDAREMFAERGKIEVASVSVEFWWEAAAFYPINDKYFLEMLKAQALARFEVPDSQLSTINMWLSQVNGKHLGYGDYEKLGDILNVSVHFEPPIR